MPESSPGADRSDSQPRDGAALLHHLRSLPRWRSLAAVVLLLAGAVAFCDVVYLAGEELEFARFGRTLRVVDSQVTPQAGGVARWPYRARLSAAPAGGGPAHTVSADISEIEARRLARGELVEVELLEGPPRAYRIKRGAGGLGLAFAVSLASLWAAWRLLRRGKTRPAVPARNAAAQSAARARPSHAFTVECDDRYIHVEYPGGERRAVAWIALTKVEIRRVIVDCAIPTPYWVLHAKQGEAARFALSAAGNERALEAMQKRLDGFANDQVISAVSDMSKVCTTIWPADIHAPPRRIAAGDFAAIKLRRFVSPGFGIVLEAPEDWVENSDQQFFQVIDPAAACQFTASAYENPGQTLEEWASTRLSVVDEQMPYLQPLGQPFPLNGKSWTGIAAEYRGVFPGNNYQSHYLVLCLCTEKVVISFTVTAELNNYMANESLYRWLLAEKLVIR